MTTALCSKCRTRPVLAIGLCRPCGLREVEAEKARIQREERRQRVRTSRERQVAAPLPTIIIWESDEP
jgi:hypothetical protein